MEVGVSKWVPHERPLSLEKQRNGTLPSTLPGTFGYLGLLSPVAGGLDSKHREIAEELIFGPLRNSNVIHCMSRNETWKVEHVCVIEGSPLHRKIMGY